jgi:hypothetical protein
VTRFAPNAVGGYEQRVIHPGSMEGGHGGGDTGLMVDFLDMLEKDGVDSRSSIDRSVESHIMAYAAEEARVTGKNIDLHVFKEQLKDAI